MVPLIFFLTLQVLSIVSALPDNPIMQHSTFKSTVSTLIPQGWDFFSKDPREQYFDLIPAENNQNILKWPNSSLDNHLGFDRSARAQGTETGMLYEQLDTKNMTTCKEDLEQCIELIEKEQEEAIKIENRDIKQTICGDYYFVLIEPLPWAWSQSTDRKHKELKIQKIEVSCSA